MAARRALGIDEVSFQSAAMKDGIALEKEVVAAFVQDAFPHATATFPSIATHATKPFLVCSPDCIVKATESCDVLLEVKTGLTSPTLGSYNDQVQLNLLVTGCSQCFVLFYSTSNGRQRITPEQITVTKVQASFEWQQSFLPLAHIFYDTYLSWLDKSPPDITAGRRVLEALLAKAAQATSAGKRDDLR